MKPLLFLTALLGICLSAGAQSQEETLQWIKSKINATHYATNEFFDCTATNNGEAYRFQPVDLILSLPGHPYSLVAYEKIVTDNTPSRASSQADLSDLTNARICDYCTYCGDHVPLILSFKQGTVKNTGINNGDEMGLYLHWDAEPNLRDRMLKALLHLVELQTPKEAF